MGFCGPDEALRVKIGLAAGEPVTEEDDLFGAAVQLAARLCDQAGADGILVSAAGRDLCIGKTFGFLEHGELTLRGFDEPVRAYSALEQRPPPWGSPGCHLIGRALSLWICPVAVIGV
jgi:class 3 adenylate cyclase